MNIENILVTGASGYIASHLITILLQRGHHVRGTVRSVKAEKNQFLYSLVPDKKDNLTLIEADLQKPEDWKIAVQGCKYVIHVASPIPPGIPKDENEIIKPAVEGTLNVLRAAAEDGEVRKVIVTSSCLAIFIGNEDQIVNESHWGDPNKCAHYPKSKILAERAAWDFWENNKDKFDFAVVNPSLVFGPQFTIHGNSSEGLFKALLTNEFPGLPDPDVGFAIVDVRDAAEAHYKALFNPNSNGKRFIACGETATIEDIVRILSEHYKPLGYKFPESKISVEELRKIGTPIVQRSIMLAGKTMRCQNNRSISILSMQYKSLKQTILDMAESQIRLNLVKK